MNGIFNMLQICLIVLLIMKRNDLSIVTCQKAPNTVAISQNMHDEGVQTEGNDVDTVELQNIECQTSVECMLMIQSSVCVDTGQHHLNKKVCRCPDNFVITDPTSCRRAARYGEFCHFDEQCIFYDNLTQCNIELNVCQCNFISEPNFLSNSASSVICEGRVVVDEEESDGFFSKYDLTIFVIIGGMVLMFIIICVVFQLFSREAFEENRTIFNTPNPRLMNASFVKDSTQTRKSKRVSRQSTNRSHRGSSNRNLSPFSNHIGKHSNSSDSISQEHECVEINNNRTSPLMKRNISFNHDHPSNQHNINPNDFQLLVQDYGRNDTSPSFKRTSSPRNSAKQTMLPRSRSLRVASGGGSGSSRSNQHSTKRIPTRGGSVRRPKQQCDQSFIPMDSHQATARSFIMSPHQQNKVYIGAREYQCHLDATSPHTATADVEDDIVGSTSGGRGVILKRRPRSDKSPRGDRFKNNFQHAESIDQTNSLEENNLRHLSQQECGDEGMSHLNVVIDQQNHKRSKSDRSLQRTHKSSSTRGDAD